MTRTRFDINELKLSRKSKRVYRKKDVQKSTGVPGRHYRSPADKRMYAGRSPAPTDTVSVLLSPITSTIHWNGTSVVEHGQKRVHATIPTDNTLCDISIYAENIYSAVITVIPRRYNRIIRIETCGWNVSTHLILR